MAGYDMTWISTNEAITCLGNVSLYIAIIKALNEMRFARGSSYTHTCAAAVYGFQIQRSICEGKPGSSNGKLRGAPDSGGIEADHMAAWIKVQNLSAQVNAVAAGIEAPHRSKPALARHQGIPELLPPRADGGDHSQTGDCDYRQGAHATSASTRRFTSAMVSSTVRMEDNSSSVA